MWDTHTLFIDWSMRNEVLEIKAYGEFPDGVSLQNTILSGGTKAVLGWLQLLHRSESTIQMQDSHKAEGANRVKE